MTVESSDGGYFNPTFDAQAVAWKALFRSSVAIGAYLEDETLVVINHAMVTLLGHSIEALEAKGFITCLYPDPAEQAISRRIVSEVLCNEPRQHQRTITRGDGSKIVLLMISQPIRVADGRRGVLTMAFDITAVPEPMSLTQPPSADGLDRVLVDATEVFARADARTGAVLFVTPPVERLLGYSPAEYVANPRLARSLVLDEYREAFDAAFARVRAGEAQWVVVALRRKDGHVVVAHVALYPVRDPVGRAVVVEIVVRDITAVRALESRLEQTVVELRARNEELASLDRLKSRLLANVSHELRTPLVSIRGYNELLLRGALGPLTDRQRRGLEIASANTNRLIELIETLIDFAHREEGRLAVRRARLDLRLPVRDALAQAGDRMRARGLVVDVELGDEPLEVQADHARLVQVLKALLSNAEKFCEPGARVRLAARRSDGRAVVEVADTGIGIPREAQAKIFERFYQVDPSETRRFGGAGLGLALAREIVSLHEGDIAVESQPGRGATFTVRLPLARPEAARDAEKPVLLVGGAGARQTWLRQLLERQGFAVLEASTGTDLVRRARRHRPDAAVLAFAHAELRETLAVLRREADTHELPIAAVVDESERADALCDADFALTEEELDKLPQVLRRLLTSGGEGDAERPRGRILVVDDDAGVLDFTRFVLEREGYRVTTAVSGDAALETLVRPATPGSGDFDLVVLDTVLEAGDGLELCRRIKRAPDARAVPVLITTARTDGTVRRDSFAAGADGFLLKPFGVDDFLRQVRLHVRLARPEARPDAIAGGSTA